MENLTEEQTKRVSNCVTKAELTAYLQAQILSHTQIYTDTLTHTHRHTHTDAQRQTPIPPAIHAYIQRLMAYFQVCMG